jgi:Outer membrane efflux protein
MPLVVDMDLAKPFYDVFDAVDVWQRKPDRSLDDLPGIIAKIPELEDVDVEGRSVLEPYRNYKSTLKEFLPENEEGLEDLLQSAVRISLEYRMDLMNDRAMLYDMWRQIRVTANALKGVFNLALTNNVYTPVVTNTNPFGFLSQAKQFSLTLNAELPLVRMTERNNFRTALINYQRQRRALQNAEDNLKIQLRNDLRTVHSAYIGYEIAKRNYELNVRLKDQSFEQIVAPPAGGTQSLAQSANAATQTTNLLNFQGNVITAMLNLTNGWQAYQTARLFIYRDIGILPYDEWEAFSELFPAQYHGPIIGQAPAGGTGFTPPAEASAATPERR